MIILKIYLLLCFLIFISWIIRGAYDDIFIGPDHKFGYNYNSWFFWIFTLVMSVPFVNLLALTMWIFGYAWQYIGPWIKIRIRPLQFWKQNPKNLKEIKKHLGQ